MREKKVKKIVKHQDRMLNWDTAIEDARELISEYASKIRGLKVSIRAFERKRERGVPWPGSTGNAEIGLLATGQITMKKKEREA